MTRKPTNDAENAGCLSRPVIKNAVHANGNREIARCQGCGCTNANPCYDERGHQCYWMSGERDWCSVCAKRERSATPVTSAEKVST